MEGATSGAAGASDVSKAVVKNVDMEHDMQQSVIEIATESMIKFQLEKDMAAFVKRAVDDQYGPTWHVIVGKSFGSYVTHETNLRSWTHGVFDLARLISDVSVDPRREFQPTPTNAYMDMLRINKSKRHAMVFDGKAYL